MILEETGDCNFRESWIQFSFLIKRYTAHPYNDEFT
jgi:hypothetical protein